MWNQNFKQQNQPYGYNTQQQAQPTYTAQQNYQNTNQNTWGQNAQQTQNRSFSAFPTATATSANTAYGSAGAYGMKMPNTGGYVAANTHNQQNQHGAYGQMQNRNNQQRSVQNNTPYRAQPVNSLSGAGSYGTDSKKRSIVAAVTKLHEKFCFIDSDIFCQLSLFRLLGCYM